MEKVHSGMAVKSEVAKDEEEIEVEGENGNNNECWINEEKHSSEIRD